MSSQCTAIFSPYLGDFNNSSTIFSYASGLLSAKNLSIISIDGGKPVRSNDTLFNRRSLSASSFGCRCWSSSLLRTKKSISFLHHLLLSTLGKGAFLGAVNAQCFSYFAP